MTSCRGAWWREQAAAEAVAHYQDAINERAVTIDRGGCVAARSEHSVIAMFGMTFLFLRWKDGAWAQTLLPKTEKL
jgi:hypothetical protein